MHPQIACLKQAAAQLGLRFQAFDQHSNLICIAERYFFQINRTPFNSEVMFNLCRDKEHHYQLLKSQLNMPFTKGYLTPFTAEAYQQYCEFPSLEAIIADIEQHFAYPLVIKRNKGALGNHVYRCDNQQQVLHALQAIYNPHSADFDYLALAQTFIAAKAEYRVVFFRGDAVLAYQRQGNSQTFNAKYWQQAEAKIIPLRDPELLEQFQQAFATALCLPGLDFVGLDVLIDQQDTPYLLELNSSPQFKHYIEFIGPEDVVAMYATILRQIV